MSVSMGKDAKLYYKVGGVASSSGTWTELTNCKDVTLNHAKGEADVTTRGNDGYKAVKGALIEAAIEFEMEWDTADAGFEVIQDAYVAGSVIGLACLDGDKTTGTGLVADCAILAFNRSEPLNDSIKVKVTAKPTYSATAPSWMDSGSPALS